MSETTIKKERKKEIGKLKLIEIGVIFACIFHANFFMYMIYVLNSFLCVPINIPQAHSVQHTNKVNETARHICHKKWQTDGLP